MKKPPKTNVFRGAADARQMMRKENNSLDAIKMELFYFKMELFYLKIELFYLKWNYSTSKWNCSISK